MSDDILTAEKKAELRAALASEAKKLLGIKYEYGAEWTDYTKLPSHLDCSELVEGVFKIVGLKMPDGGQAQYNFTVPVEKAAAGDLAFFGKNGKIDQIYHVGLVFDDSSIIEARGFQADSSFKTGEVILRPRSAWEKYKNFVGFRTQPKLV